MQAARITALPSSPLPGAEPATPTGAGDVFAALLARMNPVKTQPIAPRLPQNGSSLPQRNGAQDMDAHDMPHLKVEPREASKPQPRSNEGDANTNPALGTMVNVSPPPVQTQAQPKSAQDDSVAPAANGNPFTRLKTTDPELFRLAPPPEVQQKPGQPTLPVMPPDGRSGGDEDDGAVEAQGFTAAHAPAMPETQKAANPVLHLLRPSTPAQTTEAQALPVKADDKPDGNSGNGGSRSGSDPQQQHRDAQTQAAPQAAAQPAQHAAPPPPAFKPEIDDAKPAPMSAAAPADVPSAQSTSQQPAALQVTTPPQAHTAPSPDLAALAVNIAAKKDSGSRHFDIRLDPPELGRIEVRLSVDDSGKAQAHLSADKPQTLDLLQRDSSTLTRALKESGIELGSSGLQFSLRGQDRDGGAAQRSFGRGRTLAIQAVADAAPTTASPLTVASDRLDIRV